MIDSLMTIEELLSSVKGTLLGQVKDFCFLNVETDSRNVCEKTLFVPLVGEFQDGHKYVKSALEKGASVVFINNSEYEKNGKLYWELLNQFAVAIICVENTLKALQDAAEGYVEKFPSLKKICVTGSCGKTTTKELLVSVFQKIYASDLVYTKGNFNSETGLPLSVFQIRENHKVAIFEMGMNRENEIGEISKVLKAQFGIITNIGSAHIGILGSRKNIAREKRKAFDYIGENGLAFIYAEDDFADYCTENLSCKVVKYGSKEAIEKLAPREIGVEGTAFKLNETEIILPLGGKYNFINALGVIAIAKEFGISDEKIKEGIESLPSLPGRMEIKNLSLKNAKKVTVIKDCYNANPDSMKKSIDFVKNLQSQGQKIYILADMKELGQHSLEAHKEIGQIMKNTLKEEDLLILIGPEMKYAYEFFNNEENVKYFESNTEEVFSELSNLILEKINESDILLLKGSNSMKLENILSLMLFHKEVM